MGIYVQHGYGKTSKIEDGLGDNSINGIILSPKYLTPNKLIEYTSMLNKDFANSEIMIDPQFYFSNVENINIGKLDEHSYFKSNLTRLDFLSPVNLNRYIQETIDWQETYLVSSFISPTIYINNFSDSWSQTSLQLAMASSDYAKKYNKKLYISLCFSQYSLNDMKAIDEYLNLLSSLDVDGFYIIVERDDRHKGAQIEENILSNLLYFCYALSTINKYEVIVGYSGLLGIPLHITGIKGFGCGWWSKLNRFRISNDMPSTGGNRPRVRYLSKKLMNKILIIPELQAMRQLGLIDEVLSSSKYDHILAKGIPDESQWTPLISCLHNWEVIDTIIKEIDSCEGITSKLDFLNLKIEEGLTVYKKIHGIQFDSASNSTHLKQWKNSIQSFRKMIRK